MNDSPDSLEDQPLDESLIDLLVELDTAIREGASTSQATIRLTAEQREDWEAARVGLATLEAVLPRGVAAGRPAHLGIPRSLGRFTVEDVVGAGGFAVVYRGRDPYLGRAAALKVPRPHALVSADLRERFVREAKAAAALDHPHIVATYEAGDEHGIPFTAYAYCEGPTLSAWIRARKIPIDPRQAARLLIQLAEAVQFSHAHGILHRDIKPGNVLLFPDAQSSDSCFPFIAKLSDFGLAKLMESELEDTGSSILMGTPLYMAPEQTADQAESVGPATDVYGLGTVLYELLTNRPVFEASTPWEALDQVRNCEPVPPRKLVPEIPPDLDTICRHCLAKEPRRRYATPTLLADDLQHYLEGRPIAARPMARWEQVWSWCRRNPSLTGLTATTIAAVVALMVGLALYTVSLKNFGHELGEKNTQLVKAVTASRDAEKLSLSHAKELRGTLYTIEVGRAAAAWRNGDVLTMTAALEPFATVRTGEEDLREFGWHYLWKQRQIKTLFQITHPAHQYAAAFSPDGREVAFAGADSVVRMYATSDFRLIRELPTGQKEINSLAFGPQAAWLATTGDDGTVAVWNLPDGREKYRRALFDDKQAFRAAYSEPLQSLIVCGNKPEVHVLDAANGESRQVLQGVHLQAVESLTVSHDGLQVVTCGGDRRAVVWDLRTGQPRHELASGNSRVNVADWSPDDRLIVLATADKTVQLWNAADGQKLAQYEVMDDIRSLRIAPGGMLVTGDRAGIISTVLQLSESSADTASFRPTASWPVHRDRVYGLDISSDGHLVATGARGGGVAVIRPRFEAPYERRVRVPPHNDYAVVGTVGPDRWGRVFRVSGNGIRTFPSEEAAEHAPLFAGDYVRTLLLMDDVLFASAESGMLLEWDLQPELAAPRQTQVFSDQAILQILPLGSQQLLIRGDRQELAIWNKHERRVEQLMTGVANASVSPEGRLVALAAPTSHLLRVLDARTLAEFSEIKAHTESVTALVFSRSGQHLYTGSSDRSLAMWDVTTLRERLRLRGHEAAVTAIAVSPDNRVLASGDELGSLRLWDLQSGRELFELFRHEERIQSLEFRSDGQELRGWDTKLVEFRWTIAPTQLQ